MQYMSMSIAQLAKKRNIAFCKSCPEWLHNTHSTASIIADQRVQIQPGFQVSSKIVCEIDCYRVTQSHHHFSTFITL